MKKKNNIKIILFIIVCLCMLTACSKENEFQNNMEMNNETMISNDNNVDDVVEIDEIEEMNLGDACSDCKRMCRSSGESASYCNRSCASSCGGGGGNVSRPTATPVPTPEPTPCPAGMAGSPGSCHKCDGRLEYTATSNLRSCSKCKSGEIANSSHTGCIVAPVILLVNPGSHDLYFSKDETASPRTLVAKTYDGATLGTVSWSGPGAGFSLSGGNTSRTLTFTGDVGTFTFNVTASTATGSASASGTYTRYQCSWSDRGMNEVYRSPKPSWSGHKTNPGCNFYEYAGTITNSRGQVGYKYNRIHSRCCNPNPEPSDFGGCYGDEPYRGIATQVAWSIMDEPSGNLKYRYDEIGDKGSCNTMAQASVCTKDGTTSTSPKAYSTTYCEDTVSFDANITSEVCSVGNKSFYTINCDIVVETNFDMDDNVVNNNYNLFRGQGFNYNVGAKEITKCEANFYADQWLNAYDKVKARLQTVKTKKGSTSYSDGWEAYKSFRRSGNLQLFNDYVAQLARLDGETSNTNRLIFEQVTIAGELEELVTYYNNYKVPDDMETTTDLTMSYKLVGSNTPKSYNYIFDSTKESCEPKKVTGTVHHAVTREATWLKTPSNYTSRYEKVVNLYPQATTISKLDGTIVKNEDNTISSEYIIEGGNKVYFDNKTAAGNVPIEIVVGGLARNDSSVTNKKCNININEPSILYRPVELKNPFINDSWKKGDNWVNSLYDFTKTIHADTWNKSSLYVIDLTPENIDEVKASNKRNSSDSPYLGLCDRQKSTAQDSITKKICNIIK